MSKKSKRAAAAKKAKQQTEAVQPKSAADLKAEEKREHAAAQAVKHAAGAGDGKVLVKNGLDGVHVIGLPHGASKEGGVHLSLTLMPGINSVDAKKWEHAKQQKMVQIHLDEGTLVEFGKRGLAELGDRAAVRLVKETVDRALLESWVETEERKVVLDAIEKQLAAIAPTPQTKNAEDDEGDEDDADDEDGDDDE